MSRPAHVPYFLEELPRRFADFLSQRGEATPALWLGAALVSQRTLDGGVSLDLREYAGRPWPDDGAHPGETAPALDEWSRALRASAQVGAPGDFRPLILTGGGRLYLHRYWEYEDALARNLAERAATRPAVDRAALRDAWRSLPDRDGLSGGQRTAVVAAALRGLSVISGGAGTGKTTIVACILKLLSSQSKPERPLSVRLAAPTGKAAGRLKEQLREHRQRLDPEGAIDEILPEDPATLHRLLGGTPGSSRFRHDATHPLPVDVLVIDESSMVDLALMAKVIAALPRSSRLVLIGDKDQLPPVGVGSVFGDLCPPDAGPSDALSSEIEEVTGTRPAVPSSGPADVSVAGAVTLLRQSFRFAENSGIGALADAIRNRDGGRLARLFENPPDDLRWLAADTETDALGCVDNGLEPFLDAVKSRQSPAEVLDALGRFRILCVLRDGPGGVATWNARVEAHLRRRRRIETGATWYPGRPILVTRNDYALRLWNGDIGVALRDEDGLLRVHFEGRGGEIKSFPPGRLSHVDTAWALTVHKSQGSEFERVLFVLPESDSRLMTRELLYTGATRARRRLDILGDARRFAEGMHRSLPRHSGLAEALGLASEAPESEAGRPPATSAGSPQGELF